MIGAALKNVRQIFPLVFGLFLGSLVSLLIFPYFENVDNQSESSSEFHSLRDRCPAGSDDMPLKDEFEPVLKLNAKNSANSIKKDSKILRPRFYATELGVKDKLFVAVVHNGKNPPDSSFIDAINKTTAHHVNRLMFVFGDHQQKSIGTSENRYSETSKFLSAYSYVIGRFGSNYDWFFFISDQSYIKAFKLFEFVTHLSSGYDVILGKKVKNSQNFDQFLKTFTTSRDYCAISAGLLISNGAANRIQSIIDLCKLELTKSDGLFVEDDPSLNFGKCMEKFAYLECTEEWKGKSYKSSDLPQNIDAAQFLDNPHSTKDTANHAVSISNVKSTVDLYLLHKHFCSIELDQINDLIENIETELMKYTNSNNETVHWPIGLTTPLKPKSRFEVPKWDYFTKNEIFEFSNHRNFRKLDGINKKDVENVLNFTLIYIQGQRVKNSTHVYNKLEFVQILNGYRKFDPVRGMEYLLDLEFKRTDVDQSNSFNSHVTKRFCLIRPLAKAEMLNVPYVTESDTVVLILPVVLMMTSSSRDDDVIVNATFKFLADFERDCLEREANVKLILIFPTFNNQAQNADGSTSYRSIIDYVTALKRKYPSANQNLLFFETKVIGSSTTVYTQIKAANLVLRNFGSNFLFFLINPFITQVSPDLLNRVRMNVVLDFQVFFPIPFVKYRLNSGRRLSGNVDYPDVSKSFGRFDKDDYSFVGFHGNDLYRLLTNRNLNVSSAVDLIDLFLRAASSGVVGKNLHILRYPEPSLIVNHHEKQCQNEQNAANYANCVYSQKEGLASKAQLASLIMERGLA